MVELNTRFHRFLKEKRVLLNILLFLLLFCFISYSFTSTKRAYKNAKNNILKIAREKIEREQKYSEWPTSSISSLLNSIETKFVQQACVNTKLDLNIENLNQVLAEWKKSPNEKCVYLYDMLNLIYDISFHDSKLFMSDLLKQKVKQWLNNDENLLKQAYEQKLIIIYNRFTNEENVFNPLRQKKPQKKPDVSPSEYYQKTMAETSQNCDFCAEESTAYSQFGRLKTANSYTAANLFPFDSPHELLLPRKHDILQLSYAEFNDMFKLSTKWFQTVYNKDQTLKYPVLLWDFLYKGGASQTHPHLHLTMNPKRYYSSFEAIRSGAEEYFKETNRNYFTDLATLHISLGLTLTHKSSLVLFSLTPKKDYDAIILSDSFDDSVIELIYAFLKTYTSDLNIFPFSMTIYYPSLDSKDIYGRIPLYCKIIPRGDISSIRSDISTLELMSTFNSNLDQFKLSTQMSEILNRKLKELK